MTNPDFAALARANPSPDELKSLREARAFLDDINGDPEARSAMMKAFKKKHPNVTIPELDMVDRVKTVVESVVKPAVDSVKALQKRDDEQQASRFWGEVAAKVNAAGLPTGAFADIQKLMTEQGISNPDIAIQYFKSTIETKPADYNWRGSLPDGKSDEEKGLLEDPRSWAKNQAHKAIDELNRQAA